MSSIRLAVLVAVLSGANAAAAAAQATARPQRGVVVGTVTDSATGAGVAGASVTFEKSGRTLFTDAGGKFSIKLATGPEVITVEQLGYNTSHLSVVVDSGMPPQRVQLSPNPVALKGIAVINRRLNSSSLAIAMSVRSFSQKDLAIAGGWSVGQFLNSRGAVYGMSCPQGAWSSLCIWSRGQVVEPRVWLDDMRLYGGLEELSTVPIQDIYRVDVYQRGLYIHVVSKWWMENAIRRGFPTLTPFF